jgi:putative ABC transport system permease protein
MLSALHRKLLRDLWHMKSQAVAISLVMGCGVATFVMSVSTAASMYQNQARYYERFRFADVFVNLKRAPASLAPRLAAVPGVARMQARVVAQVNLDVPGMSEPAQGSLISIPDRPEHGLNELHLRLGRYPEPAGKPEVLLHESFASAHHLRPGDSFHAIINGKKQVLVVSGVALSPEYIYPIRPGELLPDDRRYGIIWMRRSELEASFDMKGAFNNASLSLLPGANASAVIKAIDTMTEAQGGLGAYTREDQVSHRFVSDELSQLRAMATIPPAIFLVVAGFLLNIVIARLVRTQREQIAALKAFGYTNRRVALHYVSFAAVITVAGIIAGTAAGAWMGRGMTRMYVKFFRFPHFEYDLHPAVVLGAAVFAGAAALIGVITAVRDAARLPPAEAMRPEPPASYRPTFVERLGLQDWFSQTARMVFRQIERQPVKALFSVLGVALAVAVMILGSFSKDLITFILEFQFQRCQRQDATVAFNEPSENGVLHALSSTPGIRKVEGFRSVGSRLRHEHRSHLVSIMGLEERHSLFQLLDMKGTKVALPREGMIISQSLAEILSVRAGDSLEVEVLELDRPRLKIRISGTIDDFSGTSAYMNADALNRAMKEGPVVSGAFVTMDGAKTEQTYRELKNMPRVAGVNLKRAAIETFNRTMSENLLRMRLFNIGFASIIAFGVVYNAARIALSECGRDLATLRVLGFNRREISHILLGEIGTLIAAGLPVGMLVGYGFAALAVEALQTRTQRFPLVVEPHTFATAVVVVLIAAAISALVVRRRLDHLDLVEVLKSRE